MPKHTQLEMEQMSFEDLKKNAAEDAAEPEKKEETIPENEGGDDSFFTASVEIDLEDGSGVQVFEAQGDTEAEAHKNLNDRLVEAQRNATKKIREQETRLREFEAAKKTEAPKTTELSPDDEYVIIQELQKSPSKAFRKLFKQFTGAEPEEFANVKQAFDAFKTRQQTAEVGSAAVSAFLAAHPDYEDDGKEGEKNTRLMQMQFKEMGLAWPPKSSDELTKAYLKLKESGLLILRDEGAQPDTSGKDKEPERIAQAESAPASRATKKVTSIGTQNRTTATPVNTEPSEDDAYSMDPNKLKQLANAELQGKVQRPAWAR